MFVILSNMSMNENTVLLLTTFVMQNNLSEFTETLKDEDMSLYLNSTNYKLMYILYLKN